jgi:hypothetical protein
MDIFEEANTDIHRALELDEPEVAVEIAREALREASRLGLDDLAEQLSYCIETGHIGKMNNIINAMNAKTQEWDLDNMRLHLRAVEEMDPMAMSGYNSMN